MIYVRHFKYVLMFSTVFIIGFGIAFILPFLAKSQSRAAISEINSQVILMSPHIRGTQT